MNKAADYSKADVARSAGGFLPDFCRQESLVPVMVIAELLAVVLTAAQYGVDQQDLLVKFALVSLFVQWVAMCDLAVLCTLRGRMARLSDRWAGLLGFVLLQLVTLAVTLAMGAIVGFTGLALILPQDWFGDQLRQNLVISAVVTAVALRYFYVQSQLRRRLAAEAEARVQALQARIRPHFLFNSMNTIASLTRIDAAKAEQAVQDLSELFRASLAERDHLSLAEEIETTRTYLRMEQLRLGPRLQCDWRVDVDAAAYRLPALTLQPLVENAVYHGIEQLPEGGCIAIRIDAPEGELRIRVGNPLNPQVPVRPGNRIAQDNVRQRLALAYGSADRLQVEQSATHYRVELRIPANGSVGPAGGR